jgi:hypothetical protein
MLQYSLDVRIAGAGQPTVESLRPPALGLAPRPETQTAGLFTLPVDSVAADLVGVLLQVIEARRFSAEPAVLETLLQTASAAIARHDIPHALTVLAEYIERDPDHAPALLASPALEPVHEHIREMLDRITVAARTEAQRLVAAAADAPLGYAPVLAAAQLLLESGQLAGYIRASELCRAIDIGEPRKAALPSRKFSDRTATMWRRTPLLVLLIVWLAAGTLLAVVFRNELIAAIWGTGFLALVVLQFLVTTRNHR